MALNRSLHILLGLLGLLGVPATAGAQVTTQPPQSANILATGTTASRPLAAHLGDTIKAQNFGACTWDGAHDVAPCIQAALNAAAAAGGGDVVVPVGSYNLASTLTISADLVRLVSAGGSEGTAWDDITHQGTFPTTLSWTGSSGAPMLTIAPVSNTSSGHPLRGNGVKGILLNANAVAGYGAKLLSVRAGEFRFGFRNAVSAGVLLDTVPLGESNDVQANSFSIRGTNGDTDGDGIRFQATGNGGAANGNISLNIFDYAWLRVRNGWCLNFTSASPYQSADNNYFRLAQCQQVGNTAGSGGGIHLVGGSQQVFEYYSGAAVVQETGTAGNIFRMLDTGNGTQAPTVNGGGPVIWTDNTGITHNAVFAGQTVIGDYPVDQSLMQSYGVYSPSASLQIMNSADNQIRLWNWNNGFTDGWAITTDTPTGNLRFLRLAGSGGVNLGNGAPVLAGNFTGTPTGAAITAGPGASSAFNTIWTDLAGTTQWGAMASGGNLQIARIAGAGTLNLGNGVAVSVPGALAVGGSLQLAPATPASSSAACTTGQLAADTSYVYVCTATNSWKRAALSSW